MTSHPIPGILATLILGVAFVFSLLSQAVDADVVALKSKGGLNLLLVDGFSRLFEILFFGAILAASIASLDRLPVGKGSDSETLYNNRRQVDFYIIAYNSIGDVLSSTCSRPVYFVHWIGVSQPFNLRIGRIPQGIQSRY